MFKCYNTAMKELIKKLIAAKSTTDVGEIKCAKVLADFFRSAGIKSNVQIWNKTRANITATVKSKGNKNTLLFVGHLDVVPALNPNDFKPAERNGKIFGRGSCDMKAGLAATATAITEIFESKIKLKGDIIFAATAGEETDSSGVENFVKHFKKQSLCGIIIPEPTDFELTTAHRGLIWLDITTKGKSAHSSMPQFGINAIDSMRIFLNELSKYKISAQTNKLLGKTTLSVNKISGGTAANIIPDFCRACIDIRTIPEQNHQQIIKDIYKIFDRLSKSNTNFSAELKVLRDCGSLQTNETSNFVKQLKKILKIKHTVAATFTTDGPHLTMLKAPVVIFGPGNPKLCHKQSEYVEIKDLRKGVDLYKKIILHFLG